MRAYYLTATASEATDLLSSSAAPRFSCRHSVWKTGWHIYGRNMPVWGLNSAAAVRCVYSAIACEQDKGWSPFTIIAGSRCWGLPESWNAKSATQHSYLRCWKLRRQFEIDIWTYMTKGLNLPAGQYTRKYYALNTRVHLQKAQLWKHQIPGSDRRILLNFIALQISTTIGNNLGQLHRKNPVCMLYPPRRFNNYVVLSGKRMSKQ